MNAKTNRFAASVASIALAASLFAGTASAAPRHHSKAKGAVVGAVAGHVVGGKKGAVAGAVVGAEVQHHKNKKAARRG